MQEFKTKFLKRIPRVLCDVCGVIHSFRFENPLELQYNPGQYFIIDIMDEQGVKYRHHFSFSSSPSEKGYLEFTTELRQESEFKNVLRKIKEGDVALLKAPYGEFTPKDDIDKIGMLVGGIGITALRSICKYYTDMKIAKDIILLYSNHLESDIIFRNDFDEMQSLNRNLKVVYAVSEPTETWEGYKGRINSKMIQIEIPDCLERTFFLSGPLKMVQAMDDLLKDLNVPKEQVKKEIFPGY